jgi:3-mercaptopyruvate sulfurtransferase SseA
VGLAMTAQAAEWAVFVNTEWVEQDLSQPNAELTARIRALGIDDDDHVVLYYKGNSVTEVQGAFYA